MPRRTMPSMANERYSLKSDSLLADRKQTGKQISKQWQHLMSVKQCLNSNSYNEQIWGQGHFLCSKLHEDFVRCTVYSAQCTDYSTQCTVYSVQCTVHSVQCTVYSVQCTVYSVQFTVYSAQFTVYSLQYSAQFTVYSVQCTVHSVQCHLPISLTTIHSWH